MLVRFVETFRRGAITWSRGETLDVSMEVAAVLIEAGIAVPARDRLAAESR